MGTDFDWKASDESVRARDPREIAASLLVLLAEHPLHASLDDMRAAAIDLLTRERDVDETGPDDGVRWLLGFAEAAAKRKAFADEGWIAVRLRRVGLIGMDVHAYWLKDRSLGAAVVAILAEGGAA